MIPIPQYPLYTAALTLYGGTPAPYYLDESSGWQLDISELERAVEYTSAQGKTAKAIVVINPGNPTGAIFSADTIKQIIEFSVRNRLVIIADEVFIFLVLGLSGKHIQRKRRIQFFQKSARDHESISQRRLLTSFSSLSLKRFAR